MERFDLLLRNIAELATCDGPDGPGALTLGLVPRAALGIAGGVVKYLGPEAGVPVAAVTHQTRQLDCGGGFVSPGLVDPHTHLVFAGSRSEEFEARCQGKTYLEIAKAGGGITRTVEATGAASEEMLTALALPRLRRLLRQGVTTAEVKSGYGLTLEAELKMLKVAQALNTLQPITLIGTALLLHTVPRGVERATYIDDVLERQLPAVAAAKLARFCDAFVEDSAFTHDEARRVLTAGRALGLKPRLHVDQLTANGGAQLAAELGAVTADHLEQVSPEGIAALARAGVVAVLAPTSTLFAKVRPYAPGRALRDAGVPVALCTNVNPGSSNSENVSLVMGLGAVENGLTPAETLLGFTRSAGLALADPTLGRLKVGGPADAVVYDCSTYRELSYHFGMPLARVVIKAGVPISGL